MKTPTKESTTELAIVTALVAFALALRFYRLNWGLPEIYEEATPFWKAWDLWGWGPGRGFSLNPHFFTYPSLCIYLQFLGQGLLYGALTVVGQIHSSIDFRLMYELDKTPWFVMGRSIGAILGAATVVPTFLLGKRAGGYAAAIPAAVFVALSPLLIARSHVIEVDVPLTFFVALTCMLAMRIHDAPTLFNCAVTGLSAGLAMSAKYPGVVALVPAFVAIVMASRSSRVAMGEARIEAPGDAPRTPKAVRRNSERGKSKVSAPRPRRRTPSTSLPLQITTLLGASLLAFAATSPFVLIDAASAWHEISMAGEHMQLGHFGSDAGRGWIIYGRDWVSTIMGLPLGLTSLAGLAFFAGWQRAPWAIVMSSFFVPLFVVAGSWSRVADNYVMPLVPLGTVFGAALVAHVSRRVSAARVPRTIVVPLATVLFAIPLVAGYVTHLQTLEGDPRGLAKAWIERNVPAGSLIVSEMLGPDPLSMNQVLAWDPDVREAVKRARRQPNVYALQPIPMITMAPEHSAPFYDLGLYDSADYLIVTGAVRDRYLREPGRFATQSAFYDGLKQWTTAQEFRSGKAGSDIVIYRNPDQSLPFARRAPGPVPRLAIADSTLFTGEEQALYYNMGLNYEGFGFLNRAIEAYQEGLRFPSHRPERYTAMSQRIAGCLTRQQRVPEALAFLESAARLAPTRNEASVLRRTRDDLMARGTR